MAALHGWRVPEDSPEIRGEARAVGVDLIAGGRERPRRVRRPEPVGSMAGGGEWGYPSAGADSRWWVPTEGGGGVAWLVGGEAEEAREVGKQGRGLGKGDGEGEGETTERIQRNCASAAVRPVTPSDTRMHQQQRSRGRGSPTTGSTVG